uniref:Uncharacterized protein n=1 Tax=Anguilla anguilla TaxID=7936 RepID=A0A0E9WJJ1_ANGAN
MNCKMKINLHYNYTIKLK